MMSLQGWIGDVNQFYELAEALFKKYRHTEFMLDREVVTGFAAMAEFRDLAELDERLEEIWDGAQRSRGFCIRPHSSGDYLIEADPHNDCLFEGWTRRRGSITKEGMAERGWLRPATVWLPVWDELRREDAPAAEIA